MQAIKKNSKWYSSEGSYFVVSDVKVIDGKTWIFYHRLGFEKEYSCLQDAFLNRFYQNTNYNY